jgi:hypothetical protein
MEDISQLSSAFASLSVESTIAPVDSTNIPVESTNTPMPDCAWVFLVMLDENYAKGAAAAAKSLRTVKTKYPIVCMAADVSDRCHKFLECHFDQVVDIKLLGASIIPMKSKKQNDIYGKWIQWSFTKWRCLDPSLRIAKKIIMVDADSLFITNCDELGEMSTPAMTFSSPWARPYISRGMFNPYGELHHGAPVNLRRVAIGLEKAFVGIASLGVFTPNQSHYDQLLSIIKLDTKKPYGHSGCISGFDEQAITEMFLTTNTPMYHIHQRYNCIVGKHSVWLATSDTPRAWQWYNTKPWNEQEDSVWPDVQMWYKVWNTIKDTWIDTI